MYIRTGDTFLVVTDGRNILVIFLEKLDVRQKKFGGRAAPISDPSLYTPHVVPFIEDFSGGANKSVAPIASLFVPKLCAH